MSASRLLRSVAALALGLGALSAAPITFTGSLHNVDADNDGQVDDLPIYKIGFNVTAGTTVTFDALVWESTGVDLNGDGYLTGFDAQLLLTDAGGNHLQYNDDYWTGGVLNQNGSVHSYDSAMSYTFASAGYYLVGISQLYFDHIQMAQGYQADRIYYDYTGQGQTWGAWRLDLDATNGVLSNVALTNGHATPEPHEWALIITGAAGAYLMTRRTA